MTNMIMTNLNKIILCLTLFGIIFISIWLIRSLQSKTDTTTQNTINDNEFFFYQTNLCLNNKMRGLTALDISCGREGKTLLLSDLAKDGPILVYRYSDINCSVCVESEFANLRQFFKQHTEKVIILCSYEYESNMKAFRRNNLLKYPIYNTDMKAFSWDADLYDRPYYFVLHPDMKVSDFYIPETAYPEESKAYLTGVERLITK
ncbi:hypothetical protein DW103_02440 [Parabacteroides sp. AM08-6]|nr:hypothetical protein DW103_02440 [Parabacteroides sp. AM08-6]